MSRPTYALQCFLIVVAITPACFGQLATGNTATDHAFDAKLALVSGQVTSLHDGQPWALSSGEVLPVQQILQTGPDGYAQMRVDNGGMFEVYSNSKIFFRQNSANPNDVLDLVSGRVRLFLRPKQGESQRVFSPSAIISAHQAACVALVIDEDDTVRIDVIEGQVRVQHARLPKNEPVLVKAIDSILVQKNQAISRRVDRGSLYRYTARIFTAITFGHSQDGKPVEGNKLLAHSRAAHPLQLSF